MSRRKSKHEPHTGLENLPTLLRSFSERSIPLIGLLLLMLVVLESCYEKTEACLDPRATNFDVSADEDCCCTYPKVNVAISFFENDTTSLSLNKVYHDATNQPYRIHDFSFFVSQLQVQNEGGEWVDPASTRSFWVWDGSMSEQQELSDNVEIVQTGASSFSFGEIFDTGSFQRIRFLLGLDNAYNQVIPDSIQESHPLSFEPDSLWAGQGAYIFQQWVIETDTAISRLDTFQVMSQSQYIELTFGSTFEHGQGEDLSLSLRADCSKWLEGIEWLNQSSSEISQQLLDNSIYSFDLVQ